MTAGPSRLRSLPLWFDLLLVAAFVSWFYWPFLQPGIPPGDFGSDVMVGAVDERLMPSPLSFPTWNPYLMCGRPTIRYPSPFRVLSLPFHGLEPIERMKALLILYHVLSGLTMYWLVHATRAGRCAALFGGLVYPIMTHHISRTAVHGHIHLPMLYALLPLFFLALFRLRKHDFRRWAVLALVLAVCLLRDHQRTVLLCVMVSIVLCGCIVRELFAKLRNRSAPSAAPYAWTLGLFGAAFVAAVAIDAFDLVNRFVRDPTRGGWRQGEQAYWMSRWSLDNVGSLLDWQGFLGAALEPVSSHFGESMSRYVGISLFVYILIGALFPALLRGLRSRFWLVLLLFPLSVWLSFGTSPVIKTLAAGWRPVWKSPAVPLVAKAGLLVLGLALVAIGVAVCARNLPFRTRRLQLGAVAFVALGGLFFFTAPLPLLQRALFVLRDFRNPDWFGVTMISFAVAYPAALCIGALHAKYGTRRFWPLAYALLLLVAIVDFWPYRKYLTMYQDPEQIESLRPLHERIGADPEDFRVLSTESYDNTTDLGYIWHGKRLAWDFRSHSASARLREFMDVVFELIYAKQSPDEVATLAGLANVKYVVNDREFSPSLGPSSKLRESDRSGRVVVLENLDYRPWVQAYPGAHVLVGSEGSEPRAGVLLAARLAAHRIGLVHADASQDASLLAAPGRLVFTDPENVEAGRAPRGAIVLGKQPLPALYRRDFEVEPELAWSRPSPQAIRVETQAPKDFFLVVSESFHPWWSASLDGKPLPIYPAAHAFIGTFVPGGTHRIELVFRRPRNYYLLGIVSLASLGCCLALLVLGRRPRGPEPELIPGTD